MRELSEKMWQALTACADPSGEHGTRFFDAARRNGKVAAGQRRSFGALQARGLVRYREGWSLTEAGTELLRSRQAND
jgi:Mn-dependent DtxR family transcriptional regulator